MPRRASSNLHPGLILGIVAGVAVLFFVGKSFTGKKSSGFGDVTKLNMEAFLQNGNSLRGSEYVVEGTVDEKLRWTPDRGQVVSVVVDSGGVKEMIGIEVPPEFNNRNIEREQRYSFKVKFRQGGIPVATGINRL
ncbi:hypothetical protein [Luteolibacter sp. LG18]|uniref:hypothetical protein n=1 Tax=Luteolibacter sp. LG18 TaxID=2819286 RepID=UPI002B28D387|nr:hypothetical protein llg_20970 [Luteolibacter sp. LG18]